MIKIGDEVSVRFNTGECKAVVVSIIEQSKYPYALLFDGKIIDVDADVFTPTGKHYSQINEVLNELK